PATESPAGTAEHLPRAPAGGVGRFRCTLRVHVGGRARHWPAWDVQPPARSPLGWPVEGPSESCNDGTKPATRRSSNHGRDFTMDVRDKIYINGAWVPSTGKGTLDVINSGTEEVMATIPEGTAEDVDKAVQAAAAAFPGWSATSREERAKLLTRIGEALAARTDEIAEIISKEVGMPMTLSGSIQVGLPAGAFADAAKAAESFEWEEEV